MQTTSNAQMGLLDSLMIATPTNDFLERLDRALVTPDGARAAIQALNGKATGTGTLTASTAWPNEEHTGSPIPPS